jgi:hypothetical protein
MIAPADTRRRLFTDGHDYLDLRDPANSRRAINMLTGRDCAAEEQGDVDEPPSVMQRCPRVAAAFRWLGQACP